MDIGFLVFAVFGFHVALFREFWAHLELEDVRALAQPEQVFGAVVTSGVVAELAAVAPTGGNDLELLFLVKCKDVE